MADEEYYKKLRDLQKYVPFLENTIKRLKTESGKPREAQISKLQSLLVILTNTKKKLKYDALKKCEEVILKLYEKVEKKPTNDTMHKYMCRNPPDEKLFDVRASSPALENEVAFSVARQKLNKQADMTPASPSPPLDSTMVPTKPVVIPTEKVSGEKEAFFTPINEFNSFVDEPWTGFEEVSPGPQTINWPSTVFNPNIRPYSNDIWSNPKPETLFVRRNEINRSSKDRFDVWTTKHVNSTPANSQREIIDYSDHFDIAGPPKPVPPPVLSKETEKIFKEEIPPPEIKKRELIKIHFPHKEEVKKITAPLVTSLNKPPLSESDLQDLLSSSTASPVSGEQSPIVNEDMDLEKLEELKEKLCKELEESKKKDHTKIVKPSIVASSTVPPIKPKSPRVIERVVKEQDNIFGSLLSSIDDQIMGKNKEIQKKKDDTVKKDTKKVDSKHKKDEKNDKHKDKSLSKSKDKERKHENKDKTINKTDVSKLNEKIKHSYFKDDKNKSEDDSKKDKHKEKSKSNDSKHESKSNDSKHESKSNDSKHESKKDSKSDHSRHNSKNKLDKPKEEKRSSKEKQKIEDVKDVKQKTEEPKKESPIDIIIKEIKEGMKNKEQNLNKFGDSVREMQENIGKTEPVKDDDRATNSGRLSDKYPHKRKPSIDKPEPSKSENPKSDPPKIEPPKPAPKPLLETPIKLSDPRLRVIPKTPTIPKFTSPNFTSPSQSISPERSFAPPMNMFNYNAPFPGNMGDPYMNIGNRTPGDPFANNMGSMTPGDPFLNNMGGMTPGDPFANNVGSMTPGDPYANNMGSMTPGDQFANNMGGMTPGDPFLGGGMTPNDPFSTAYDVDMRDPNQRNIQFPNFNSVNQNSDQYWVRGSDQCINRPNQRFQNFSPRFSGNQPRMNFQNMQHQEQQNFNNYDLSQMNPIDFYEEDNKQHSSNRGFRGRGNINRGNFRGRGQARNIQWVNPIVRDDSINKHEEYQRKPLLGRFPNDPARFANEDTQKDNRRSRFSIDDNSRSRFTSDENKPESSRTKPPRFSSEDKEEIGKKPTRFSSIEDPKKHYKKPEEDKSSKTDVTDSSKKKEDIISPLNSLYSSEMKKVGKGYGFQNFKIPKIRRSVEETKEESKKEVEKPKESEIKVEETKPAEEPEKENIETKKSEEVKIEEEKKADVPEEIKPEPSVSKEENSDNNTKSEADEKLDMFNNFMKHIFDTCDSSVLLQYLDKCGFALPQSKTKRIRRIIESDSESEEEENKEEKCEEIIKEPEQTTPEKKQEVEPPKEEDDIIESVGERIKNRRRKQVVYSSDSSPEKARIVDEEQSDKNEEVIDKKEKKVTKTRRKNALELLQDDLREMFISKGVLTATGKRMCRMMKEHQEQGLYSDLEQNKKEKDASSSEDDDLPLARRRCRREVTKKLPKSPEKAEKFEIPEKLPIRRTRSSPRVLLEKIDVRVAKSSSEESESESEIAEPELEPESVIPVPEVAKTVKKKITRRGRGRKRRAGKVAPPKIEEPPKDEPAIVKPEEIESSKIDPLIQNEEIDEETQSEKKKSPVKKKKKGNWAHGVIKKKIKSVNKPAEKLSSPSVSTEISDQLSISESIEEIEEPSVVLESSQDEIETISDNEEYGLLKIDIKPDVNYYLDNGNRFDCKLCIYKGKLIVHHYRTRHPESENMISRLSPEQANLAKDEAEEMNFEVIKPYDETVKGKKRRTTYQCRFCFLTFKKEFTASFFDHICCHTGEYRYSCELCPFYTGVKKTLSAHCHNVHPELKRPLNIAPTWPGPPNFRIVFGYLCQACNFTQVIKINVEKHIKLSHPNENIDIIKISMSSKSVNLDDYAPPDEETEEIEEIVEEPKEKTPDMTAFLEPDDILVREQLIEDERRKKMEEINSNITPRRSTFQFVEQLKNKLQSVLQNEEEPTIDIENHPIEETPEELTIKIASTCSLAESESSEDINKILEITTVQDVEEPEKKVEKLELHVSDEEIEEIEDMTDVELSLPVDSKQKGVLDTIHRLAAKLQSPKMGDFVEEEEEIEMKEQIINVGIIEARIKIAEQLYLCLVPNCNFSSSYKISFSKHCAENHPKLTSTCIICKKTNPATKPQTMTFLFVHLFDKHKQNIAKTDTIQPGTIRLRRISGDLLSKPSTELETILEASTQPLEASTLFLEAPAPLLEAPAPLLEPPVPVLEASTGLIDASTGLIDAPTGLIDASTGLLESSTSLLEDPTALLDASIPLLEALNQPIIFEPDPPVEKPVEPVGFFQIKDVRTLTPEEEHILQPSPVPKGPKIITKKILVPVGKIPQSLFKKTYLSKKQVHEANEGLLRCHKTKKIFMEMLKFPKILDLFKCPIELCSYSTNVKIEFSAHFTSHRWCQITVCVYCHEGVSSNNLISHIDKYHSQCLFQCAFCFYRAVNKNYVLVHQQTIHGRNYESLLSNSIFNLKPMATSFCYFNINDCPAKSTLILPYQCKQSPCDDKFLISDDFMVHLHVFHKKYFECSLCQGKNVFFMTANALISHYVQHLIAKLQCRFCLYGSFELGMMFNHYAKNHPAMKPVCFVRQFKDKNALNNTVDDIVELDMDSKIICDAAGEPVSDPQNPPEPTPSCSSPTVSTTITEPIIDQNISSSSLEESKPIVPNSGVETELVQIPKTTKLIDVIDLSVDNPQNEGMNQDVELSEPLVTLKHRSVESINAIENAIDPLFVEPSFQGMEVLNFPPEEVPITNVAKPLDSGGLKILVADLTGRDLYKCGSPGCHFRTNLASDFKIHLFTCDIMRSDYNCVHCQKKFDSVIALCNHIQIHGLRRFFCGLCKFKSAISTIIVQHMKTKHQTAYTKFEPIDPYRKDMTRDTFIVRPILRKNTEVDPPQISPQKSDKNIFGPEDIDLLPRPPVYITEIKCKLCNYNTKVRSNMQRHLQQHIEEKAVPETAPVNPVPCLQKNEKMFDKMTNLAASSHFGRMGGKTAEKVDKHKEKEEDKNYPGFIQANKRFVCGAENCNYLTHGDTMLRHHLTALHADETFYKCPHCQILIPSDVDGLEIDQILFHLKMHDLHLYKCSNCEFFHYQRHKIERHISDIHPGGMKSILIIRELGNSANLDDSRPTLPPSFTETEASQDFKPWRCGFCSYRTNNRTDIQLHASTSHNIKSQFKCGLCNFRCSAKNNYAGHFKNKHPNVDLNIISVYYKTTEEQSPKSSQEDFQEKPSFDTTPLWVKNKSGVKHIRGILLEDAKTSSKRTPKIIEKLTEIKSNLGEGTSKNVEDITKNLFDSKNPTTGQQKSLDYTPKYPSNYGNPEDNFYVCPSCEIFKTKSVKDFIAHLHEEMRYYRCACKLCDYRFVDISQAKIHWSEHHKSDGKDEQITPLTPDGKVENWVDNCIRYQHKKMKKPEEEDVDVDVVGVEVPSTVSGTSAASKEEILEVSPSKLKCTYCNFIAKTMQTFQKHTRRHITHKPFVCNLCNFETFSLLGVKQHHQSKHKKLKLSYSEVPAPEGATIQSVRSLKRKRPQSDPEATATKVPSLDESHDDKSSEANFELLVNLKESGTIDRIKSPVLEVLPNVDSEISPKGDFDTIYLCFHCPRKSDDLEVVRTHFIAIHDKIHKGFFKYKKVIVDKNNKNQYKCNYCNWFGHPDGLKQHHLDNHSDQTWICQKAVKFRCNSCLKMFLKLNPLRKHFFACHPHLNFTYQTVLEGKEDESLDTTEIIEEPLDVKPEIRINCEYCADSFETTDQLQSHHNLLHSHLELKPKNESEELKKYKCPQCGHSSNSYPAMRDHLRAHNKPFICVYCKGVFSYPNLLKSHHLKEHRNLPLEIKEQPEVKKLMDKLRESMLILGADGVYSPKTGLKRSNPEPGDEPPKKILLLEPKKVNVARKSTSLPAVPKNVAKKSTSNRVSQPEGFSFYGSKPCDINDYKNVMSEINIMGKPMPINVVAMAHVLNLFPTVLVEDIKQIVERP